MSVRLSALLGVLAFDLFRVRRKVTLANLERAFGESMSPAGRKSVGRRSYINFAKSMVEFASLRRIDAARLRGLVELEGREHVEAALAKGNGIIIVTGHFGSWEFLGAAAVAHGFEVDFLVGEQSNIMVDELMNDLRSSAGIGVIPRSVAARGIFRPGRMRRCGPWRWETPAPRPAGAG